MIKNIFCVLCSFVVINCACPLPANAQYYYKDIMANSELNKEFSILKNGNIKLIKVESFDENDQPSEGFFCEKKINKNFSQSEMMTKSNITGESVLVTDYNTNGKVIKTTTNTPTTTNTVEFQYDSLGRLFLIRTKTIADGDTTGITETHEYFYANGLPEKMLRKKNNILISTITFLADNKGNIIEEDAAGKSDDKKYYYYYDSANRLTDVVHYNVIARRLLPDYMFEYNPEEDQKDNKPIQMISVDETGRNYFIWKYAYDNRQLPEIQKCFSKEKQLLGTIQFDYQ